VEGHPSVPDGEDLERMDEIGGQVVEEHVAQPRADHEAEYNIGIEGLEEIAAERKATFFYLFSDEKEGRGKTDQVHDAVPSDGKRADAHDLWVY